MFITLICFTILYDYFNSDEIIIHQLYLKYEIDIENTKISFFRYFLIENLKKVLHKLFYRQKKYKTFNPKIV